MQRRSTPDQGHPGEIQKIQLRDPRKAEMNVEVGRPLQKRRRNPAGGCLPLVIQMPFLFAYYRMLGVANRPRHAGWGWVHDLSAPDPCTFCQSPLSSLMFFMQRLTPQAGMDPAQQKMMNFFMRDAWLYQFETRPPGCVCTGLWAT